MQHKYGTKYNKLFGKLSGKPSFWFKVCVCMCMYVWSRANNTVYLLQFLSNI